MHTCATDVAFQHLTQTHHVADGRIVTLAGSSQLRDNLDTVLEVALQGLAILLGHTVGHQSSQPVGDRDRHLLDARHVLDNHLGSHGTIGDDVRNAVRTILVLHPLDDARTTVIVEVGIDIRQRDTVGVQETFEQQVVLDRVNLGDSQAISNRRTGSRTTTRAYRNAQFLTTGTDEVGHNQEVTRETHRLHDMQLKLDALPYIGTEGSDNLVVGHLLSHRVALVTILGNEVMVVACTT